VVGSDFFIYLVGDVCVESERPEETFVPCASQASIRDARAPADIVIVSWHSGISPASGGNGELVDYQVTLGHAMPTVVAKLTVSEKAVTGVSFIPDEINEREQPSLLPSPSPYDASNPSPRALVLRFRSTPMTLRSSSPGAGPQQKLRAIRKHRADYRLGPRGTDPDP